MKDVAAEIIENDDTLAALHYLHQAESAAEFLPGGKMFGTVVDEHIMSAEEAAGVIRDGIRRAREAIMSAAEEVEP